MASIYERTSIEGQCPGQFRDTYPGIRSFVGNKRLNAFQDIDQSIESFVGIEKQSSDVFCDIWLGIQSCIKG
jgi:hypothetical protein